MSAAEVLEEQALFHTARDAVVFAVTRNGAPARPTMSTMADKTPMRSRGLGGLDGAGQAGMIMGTLERTGRVQMWVLVASCAPRTTPCACRRPCCSGRTINREWLHAIEELAAETIREKPHGVERYQSKPDEEPRAVRVEYESLLPRSTKHDLRVALLMKVFGHGSTLHAIGEEFACNEDTAGRHYRTLMRWIKGPRGAAKDDGPEGLEPAAWRDAESALRDVGIVG